MLYQVLHYQRKVTEAAHSSLTGPIFEVLAGPNRKPFTAHANVLAKSKRLKASIEGEWKESSDHQLVLEDWDEETVGRVLEWLYTGSYTEPQPQEPPASPKPLDSRNRETGMYVGGETQDITTYPNGDEEMVTTSSWTSRPVEHLKLPLPPDTYHTAPLTSLRFPTNVDTESAQESSKATPTAEAESTYTTEAILLAHAKVYVMADYMLLPGLQRLAFEILQEVLSGIGRGYWKTDGLAIEFTTALVVYVYANTTGLSKGKEPLQNLVSTFVATNLHLFKDGEEILQLMVDYEDDFAVDTVSVLSFTFGLFVEHIPSPRS